MRESAAVLDAIEDGRAKGYIASHALTTIHPVKSAENLSPQRALYYDLKLGEPA
jgi:hypothetical protein